MKAQHHEMDLQKNKKEGTIVFCIRRDTPNIHNYIICIYVYIMLWFPIHGFRIAIDFLYKKLQLILI